MEAIQQMEAIRRLVWKEWREQRTTLGLAAVLGMVLVLGLAGFLGAGALRDPLVFVLLSVLPLTVVLLTLGGDLLGGPEGTRAIGFLERMPGGLRESFLAKGLFLAGLVLSLGIYGWLLTAGITQALVGRLPEMAGHEPIWWGQLFSLSLWCFAVSPWVPRGPMALPVATFVLLIFGWPMAMLFLDLPWQHMSAGFAPTFFVISFAGALIIAHQSYSRGRRFGKGPGKAAKVGLPVVLVLASPGWAWGSIDLWSVWSVDPEDEGFRLEEIFVQEGSPYVYLNATDATPLRRERFSTTGALDTSTRGRKYALAIEVASGDWFRVGPPQSYLYSLRDHIRGTSQLLLDHRGETELDVDWETGGLVPDTLYRAQSRGKGYGYEHKWKGELGIHDPYRDRFYPRKDHNVPHRIYVMRPGWLVRNSDLDGEVARWWECYDPESREHRVLPWPLSWRLVLLTDVWVLLQPNAHIEGKDHPIYLGNVRTGELQAIEAPPIRWIHSAYAYATTTSTIPAGALCLVRCNETSIIYRFDLEKRSILPVSFFARPLRGTVAPIPGDPEQVYLLRDDALGRFHIDREEWTPIFPHFEEAQL